KDDVLGGIYRVRKTGSHKVSDPRSTMVAWNTSSPANLALLLSDPRPSWRRRAIESLGQRGEASLPALSAVLSDPKAASTPAVGGIWTACRIDSDAARQLVRRALDHADETVRQSALHAVSLWRDKAALPALTTMLKSPSRHNRRAAAE